jgi:hypothetical protein
MQNIFDTLLTLPTGHVLHCCRPVSLVYLPTGQWLQLSRPLRGWNLPAVQLRQLNMFMCFPAGHMFHGVGARVGAPGFVLTQSADPGCGWLLPDGQSVHIVEPTLELNMSVGHVEQKIAPFMI